MCHAGTPTTTQPVPQPSPPRKRPRLMNQRITPQLANNEQTRQNTLLTADIPYHTNNSTAFTYTDARIDNLHTDDRLGTAAENNARTNIETEQQSGGDATSQNPEHALETAPNLAKTTNTTQPTPAHHPPKKRARITNIRFTPPSRDSPTRLLEAPMPYTGDYRGCCWNAQALIASNIKGTKREAKLRMGHAAR